MLRYLILAFRGQHGSTWPLTSKSIQSRYAPFQYLPGLLAAVTNGGLVSQQKRTVVHALWNSFGQQMRRFLHHAQLIRGATEVFRAWTRMQSSTLSSPLLRFRYGVCESDYCTFRKRQVQIKHVTSVSPPPSPSPPSRPLHKHLHQQQPFSVAAEEYCKLVSRV